MDYGAYFNDYHATGAWDGFVDEKGEIRGRFAQIFDALNQLDDGLELRAKMIQQQYLDQGITFDFAGSEQPFPLDIAPRIIENDEWTVIDAGVKQRVKALEMFLDDLYTNQNCIKDGVIPTLELLTSPELNRTAFELPTGSNNVRIQVAGIDLVRDQTGTFRVLEDNVRVPSGVSYVLSNRRAMVQTFPELFTKEEIMHVNEYPQKLLRALKKSAPHNNPDPTTVILSPGMFNSAYFEHQLLARLMGVRLVESRDLFCSHGNVWVYTTAGPKRVDVIYRRIDDDFMDPVHFKSNSIIGVPGLVNVAKMGNVTIANSIGNGIADDKLTYTYVPDFIRYYLGEEPIIPNVDTLRLEDTAARKQVLNDLRSYVIKPVNGSGGKGIVIGNNATDEELRDVKAEVELNPRNWIAQPIVMLSTLPTWIESEKKFEPRHVDLRPFAVNSGDDIWVLPGGLTRVALAKGQLIVNSSQGGGSKDTWVLGWNPRENAMADVLVDAALKNELDDTIFSLPLVNSDNGDELELEISQQQQQQQQQIEGGGPE
jgi:uncharacterized circularly permuted ATP-grasp superfamily protein